MNSAIFARHLDLSLLGGHHTGLVRCVFHDERTPSLSVDLARGVFHCFGCGVEGGLRRFAELVGESPQRVKKEGVSTRHGDAQEQVLRRVQADAERAQEWLPWHRCNDFIRRSHQAAERARALANRLGADHPRVWFLLEQAARFERDALAVEAELDVILASGRIA